MFTAANAVLDAGKRMHADLASPTTTDPGGGGYEDHHDRTTTRCSASNPTPLPAQIKSAYRKLAKQYHPDVNNSTDAAEKFREITEAYDTLTDPDRRRRYDRLHGTGRTTFGGDDEWSRYTRPGNGTHAGNGSASSNGSQAASRLLKVLEDIWLEIRRWHPEIPPAVIIIASGTDGKQPRLGHHAPGRWNVAGEQYAEIMISGEGLRRTPDEVLGTLLHEAAHALAHARGIKDTSRQGRYHNKHFKTYAEAARPDRRARRPLRLVRQPRSPPPPRSPTPASSDDLTEAMTMWRHGETTTGPTARRNTNLIAAICPCGRSIRVAASTLAEAPITCQACDQDFQAKNADWRLSVNPRLRLHHAHLIPVTAPGALSRFLSRTRHGAGPLPASNPAPACPAHPVKGHGHHAI